MDLMSDQASRRSSGAVGLQGLALHELRHDVGVVQRRTEPSHPHDSDDVRVRRKEGLNPSELVQCQVGVLGIHQHLHRIGALVIEIEHPVDLCESPLADLLVEPPHTVKDGTDLSSAGGRGRRPGEGSLRPSTSRHAEHASQTQQRVGGRQGGL